MGNEWETTGGSASSRAEDIFEECPEPASRSHARRARANRASACRQNRRRECQALSLILSCPWHACSSRSGRTSGFELFGLRVRIERHAPVPDHLRALEQWLRSYRPCSLTREVVRRMISLFNAPPGFWTSLLHPVLGENDMCRSQRTVIGILGRSWNRKWWDWRS